MLDMDEKFSFKIDLSPLLDTPLRIISSDSETIDVINHVSSRAKEVYQCKEMEKWGGKKYCLLAVLCLKNIFNSATWNNIC